VTQSNPSRRVLLIDKAHVRRSGAISMGMDGLNNAVVPGHATPGQYVREITIANDGIVDQKTLMAYATNSFSMIEELDAWGVRFEKDETRWGTPRSLLCSPLSHRARTDR
jgi:succinate dehydrogenase/fumarate reductase flavoprotein subunit